MLQDIDLKASVDKEAYKRGMEELGGELGRLQRKAVELKVPILIIFEGWDAAGKGDSINRLVNFWDMRGVRVVPVFKPVEDELLRPYFWRFWRNLPARGQIGIFDRSWYYHVLEERVLGGISDEAWAQKLNEIRRFEQILTDDGTILVKIFLHIPKKVQKKRFVEWEKDPAFAWKVTRTDWKRHDKFKEYVAAATELLNFTHAGSSPWTVIPGVDRRYRRIGVIDTVRQSLRKALDAGTPKSHVGLKVPKGPNPLTKLDLGRKVPAAKYESEIADLQQQLRRLQHLCYNERLGVVVAFEGCDAAGKGGAIRRLVQPLDPRGYTVIPIAAPQGEEKTHHYFWRFWRHLPKAGHWAIFDRTWYGRVLVERIEGFARPEEWQRAYDEIKDFERLLVEERNVLVKFWLQIDKKEQLKRFKLREQDPDKTWKITDEDWRNREKWDQYYQATGDMVRLTSVPDAPWTMVEANDKLWARVKVLRTVCEAVANGLGRSVKV